jgi:hypothetical protein
LLDGRNASNEDDTKNGAQYSSDNGSFLLGKELSKPLKGGGLRIKETRSKRHFEQSGLFNEKQLTVQHQANVYAEQEKRDRLPDDS